MASAQVMINKALRLLGVLASSETPSAAESIDSLESLNSLIDAYSASPAYYYTNSDEAFPLVPGQGTYTIGASGNFATGRPIRLLSAFVRAGAVDTSLGVITEQYWNGIPDKNAQGVPAKVLYRPAFPLGQILITPVPNTALTIHLKTEKTIQHYATLDTDHDLPPGYRRMLELSLAVDLAAEYGNKVPEQTLMYLRSGVDAIVKTNMQFLQNSKLQDAQIAAVAKSQ